MSKINDEFTNLLSQINKDAAKSWEITMLIENLNYLIPMCHFDLTIYLEIISVFYGRTIEKLDDLTKKECSQEITWLLEEKEILDKIEIETSGNTYVRAGSKGFISSSRAFQSFTHYSTHSNVPHLKPWIPIKLDL